ncbi:MAG: SPOR domain-containing protein [Bacteroidales bacterium]|nr:SPOR domain-containing protein [Bacteroidales bacterium]
MENKRLNSGKRKLLLAVLLLMIISCMNATGQDPGFNPDRIVAERAFDNEDYTTALKHYEALSVQFRADPVYKYYTGACMVQLRQEPGRAANLLKEAINGSSAIRTVPLKSWYYLGRAYQLNGDFDLATDAYENYREVARRREVRELGLDELIDECRDRRGGLDAERLITDEGEEDIAIAVAGNIEPGEDTKIAATDLPPGPGIEYERLAREALEYQFRADSVLRLADRYRSTLPDLSEEDRQTVRAKILSLEKAGFEAQRTADQKYREAALLASAKYDDGLIDGYLDKREVPAAETETDKPEKDTVSKESDTITAQVPDAPVERPEPVLSLFSEQYKQDDIPLNPELPDGLFYRIQLAAFRNPQQAAFFRGLGPLSIYRAEGSDINFYYTGLFRSKVDADKALVKVKQKGFKDAFVIALMDGSRISMEKAEQLENKWAHISLFEQDTVIAGNDEPREPPTLVYRVEVMKKKKKAGDDELELLERLADKKSYDIYVTASGEYVYLMGKFLTFESAAAYADLLYRNGMKEAKVVAYLGEKEIPLETARELFNLYFEK